MKIKYFDEKGYQKDFREAKINLYSKRFNVDGNKMIQVYGALIFPPNIITSFGPSQDDWAERQMNKLEEDTALLVKKEDYMVELDAIGATLDKDGEIILIVVKPDGTLEKMKYDKQNKNIQVVVC